MQRLARSGEPGPCCNAAQGADQASECNRGQPVQPQSDGQSPWRFLCVAYSEGRASGRPRQQSNLAEPVPCHFHSFAGQGEPGGSAVGQANTRVNRGTPPPEDRVAGQLVRLPAARQPKNLVCRLVL